MLGFGVAALLFKDLSLFEVALLATMLAPTDAALGKAVVTNETVPNAVRQGLNVESGLNDGICVPILFLFLALATGKVDEGGHWQLAMKLVVEEIGIGSGCRSVAHRAGCKSVKVCQAAELADRNLDPDSDRCAGTCLFRDGSVDRRQRLYSRLQRRASIRRLWQSSTGKSFCARRRAPAISWR